MCNCGLIKLGKPNDRTLSVAKLFKKITPSALSALHPESVRLQAFPGGPNHGKRPQIK